MPEINFKSAEAEIFDFFRRYAVQSRNTPTKVYFCSHLINYKTTNVRFAV